MSARPEPRLVPHADEELLAAETARRALEVLEAAQDERGEATVVLTGGSMGTRVIREIAHHQDAPLVDWSRVNVWWSDERFLPGTDPERNGVQAADAWNPALELTWDRVHPVAGADEIATADAAAADYREELAAAAASEGADGALPHIDLLLLSLGPDTHVASLFPERDAVRDRKATVLGVHDAPKPPPDRVTLTLPAINAARQVWLVVAGQDKAGAVALAANGAAAAQVPAAGVRGTERTVWFLDADAAARLPSDPDAAV